MQTLNAKGELTTLDDPSRLLWYGPCGYWTDDWERVKTPNRGIPCCPTCGAPGFQNTAGKWFEGAQQFQSAGNPGYLNFLNAEKEKCGGKVGFMERFKQWLRMHPNGRDTPSPRSDGS